MTLLSQRTKKERVRFKRTYTNTWVLRDRGLFKRSVDTLIAEQCNPLAYPSPGVDIGDVHQAVVVLQTLVRVEKVHLKQTKSHKYTIYVKLT